MRVQIIITTTDKYITQVRTTRKNEETILFESPEYRTRRMAIADAECWIAFHGQKEGIVTPDVKKRVYTIDHGDTVRTFASKNGVPITTWTGPKFSEWIVKAQVRFPQLTVRVATRFDRREVTGNNFFLIIRKTSTDNERCFIVEKDH